MVSSTDVIVKVDCELQFGDGEDPHPGQIVLTEGGGLGVNFDQGTVRQLETGKAWSELRGTDTENREVILDHAITSRIQNSWLTEVDTTSAVIATDEEEAPGPDCTVVIDFDLLCFQPYIPPINQVDRDTRQVVEQGLEMDVPEKEFLYVETDEAEIYGVPFVDTANRVDYVKEEGQRLRTGKIRVKQEKNGSIRHHVDSVEDDMQRILELSQLVQETTPRFVRAKVVSIDGNPIEEVEPYYEKLYSGETADVGGRFAPFPKKILWGDFPDYLRQAWDAYTPRVRNELRLRQVLGYYVDARDPDRAVQAKLLSTCSAIELFALWHAREDETSESTGEKIQHTIDKLDVETEDLANQVVDDPSELDIPEYFWKRERNHVVHGAPNASNTELITAQEATLVLLKRLLRNQLLGAENDSFEKFYSMQPRPSITVDD